MPRFSRSRRLLGKRDFDFVFDQPRKVTQGALIALYKPNQRPYARLGIILSKQHVKRAVARNQLRRLMRESFRALQDPLKGLDIIVLMRSEWSPLGTKAWRSEIDKLWLRLINAFPGS